MYARPLVPRFELVFHDGASLALWLVLAARLAWGYFTDGHLWLLDSQILAACLLLALLNALGGLLPRNPGAAISVLLGCVTWLTALSMIPRYGWPRTPLSIWLIGIGVALLLASMALRYILRLRWQAVLRGHGYREILEWAEPRPFKARCLAQKVLHSLGYRPD